MSDVSVSLDGATLTTEQLIAIRDGVASVSISDAASERVRTSRYAVESILSSGDVVYGINTGFGALSSITIDESELARLQTNLIRSHACGVGENMASEDVLMMMTIRANSLAVGHSGIRLSVIQTIVDLVNSRCAPVVPRIGSLGASGDLAPLSHLTLGLMGENQFFVEIDGIWGLKDADYVFELIESDPVELQAKEGLSLINGTSQMCAYMVGVLHTLSHLIVAADSALSCSLEAIKGSHRAFDVRIHRARPHSGQQISAARVRSLVNDSQINASHEDCDRVQDSYSFRCGPQVHGPVIELILNTKKMIEIEINSATDNPLIFVADDGEFEVISGGNFHGQIIALAADSLAVTCHELASISERRINQVLSPHWSGQNAFLANEEGLESGLMILQYVSAALLAELHLLANPTTTSNVPVSMEKEDHVSMGATATNRLSICCDHLSKVLANELICACEALHRIEENAGSGVMSIQNIMADLVAPLTCDRSMTNDTEIVAAMLLAGSLSQL